MSSTPGDTPSRPERTDEEHRDAPPSEADQYDSDEQTSGDHESGAESHHDDSRRAESTAAKDADAEQTVVVPGGYDTSDDEPERAGSAGRDRDVSRDFDADRDAEGGEATRVMPAVDDTETAGQSRRVTRDELYSRADRQGEQERLAAVRAGHLAAAEPATATAAGGAAAGTAAGAATTGTGKKRKPPRTTDKFFPSLGLFGLRVAAAAVMGVHGVQKLLTLDQTAQFFGTLKFFGMALPAPSILALITGVAEVLIAVALLFGFLTRIAGFGMLLISVGALIMVKMAVLPNPLAPGASGFSGETELLLAGAAVLLLCVGGGSWALDRLFRRGRYLTGDDLTD